MAEAVKIGEAGLLRVMSELILRGYHPYRPAVDDHGVDIMLSDGTRIQVKTSRLHSRKRRHRTGVTEKTAYHLTLGWTAMGRMQKPIRRPRSYDKECDFLIIFGVDEQRFWIIPSFIVGNKQCLILGPKTWVTKEAMQQLRLTGMQEQDIAKALGVNRHTVRNRTKKDLEKGGFVRAVRACENKWELLNGSQPQQVVEAQSVLAVPDLVVV